MTKKLLALFLTFIILLSCLPATVFASDTSEEQSAADKVTLDDIIAAAATVVRQNEGSYSSVNPDDNGALSIGWIQWHANRALNLLKTIVAADVAKAQELLGETLYKEITSVTSWSTRILTKDEAARISALISTDAGKKAQDELAAQDLSAYILRAMGYGITDPAALVYYADIENQCGSGGAKKVAVAAEAIAGSYDNITLDILHQAALADKVAGKYASRRNKTYNNCLLLDWEIVNTKYEVWDVLTTRNVRKEADTLSELVTSISAGTKVIITEKVLFGTQTRGKTSMGWITIDDGSCALNETLTGGYTKAPISFDCSGGFFGTVAPTSTKVTKLNAARATNDLAVYDNDYTAEKAPTNAYGAECAVGADGKVIATPAWGVCKTPIPEGGFVISAHGTMYTWLTTKVKAGYTVTFDRETMTLSVYENEAVMLESLSGTYLNTPIGTLPTPQKKGFAFTGWTAADGSAVSAETLCTTPFCMSLKATWRQVEGNTVTYVTNGGSITDTATAAISGINTGRGANQLILYRDKASTGTNAYGKEAVVDAKGYVTAVYGYGIGNSSIPEGGFVLSGHGTMDKWIGDNLSVGMRVVFDETSSAVTVYKTKEIYDLLHSTVFENDAIGTVPTAYRSYHKFLGWFTADGTPVTGSTVMTSAGIVAYAKWEVLPGALSFNADGGKVGGAISSFISAGTDITRGANALVIYRTRTQTKTNAYGTEVIVDKNGTVVGVHPYGKGNNAVPAGCFILSGNGTASSWLNTYIKTGYYISVDGDTVTVWTDAESYRASKQKTVLYGAKYPALPTASREGCDFLGWADPEGNTVTEGDTVSVYGNITLTALWKQKAKVTFDAGSGKLVSSRTTVTANGMNIARGSNQLVIYAGKVSSGTNKYGTEALVGPDGRVIKNFGYGKGNNAIPDGCRIISGNGTMGTWVKANLTAGKYVVISGYKISVYENEVAFDAADGTAYITSGTKLGYLPGAADGANVLEGWYGKGEKYTASTVVSEDITLLAKWTKYSAALVLNLDGGTVSGAVSSVAADGLNKSRPANSLIIYDGDYSLSYAQTNAYGAEAAVDKNGYVISKPAYGTCKTPIPDGGFVLSAIGTKYSWLVGNVKVGNYVRLDRSSMTVTVYESYEDYLYDEGITIYTGKPYGPLPTPKKEGYVFAGWKDTAGRTVSSSTAVESCDIPVLTAVWKKAVTVTFDTNGGTMVAGSAKLSGTNIGRATNFLVLYKNKASTGTNVYGSEAIIKNDGTVIAVFSYGKGNAPIPEGAFALSGNGTMSRWITTNLYVGAYVKVEGATVSVFKNSISCSAASGSIFLLEGESLGTLPAPTRYGYDFKGWYSGDTLLRADTVITSGCTYTARWTPKNVSVTFNTNGGAFTPPASITATGTNVQRGSNALVIFDRSGGKTSTGTNEYGTEVIVGPDGIVTAVRGIGQKNAPIPEGGFVLSGHGTSSAWLKTNVAVGSYVVRNGLGITVYKSYAHIFAQAGKTVTFGTAYGPLPAPALSGKTFAGWYTEDGTHITEKSLLAHEGSPLVLYAKWN